MTRVNSSTAIDPFVFLLAGTMLTTRAGRSNLLTALNMPVPRWQ
jgi:hypothetical protein